jgi:glycosyltransferase involved in cell wall biosynthesis
MMKILFVALSQSIHTARWINQISDQGWNIHLVPSLGDGMVHPELRNVIVHHSIYGRRDKCHPSVKYRGIPVYSHHLAKVLRYLIFKKYPILKVYLLRNLIKRFKPDIVHSLEIQAAGYLTLGVKKKYQGAFPFWIVTNWGSDLYLFGRLKKHIPQIIDVLANCDGYSCECNRDVNIAKDMGYTGHIFPVFPNTGGFDMGFVRSLRQPGTTSIRKVIMVKGYQGWSGRALIALKALELCKEYLKGYEIVIYSPNDDVVIAAELLSDDLDVPVIIIPRETAHTKILEYHGRARISIGLGISDAVSTSLLEAMVMGSFPIQSWTSCGNEWIVDGKNGILVDPMDPQMVADAIRKTINDDDLVNNAANYNYDLANQRLEKKDLRNKAINFYESIPQN